MALNSRNLRGAFEDYRYKRLEIERLKGDGCVVSDMVEGSHAESPYTLHPIRVQGVDAQRRTAAKERIERLEGECADVEAAVALAPNSQIRLILTMRYIDGDTWVDIGRRLGMSESACRMHAARYLDGK